MTKLRKLLNGLFGFLWTRDEQGRHTIIRVPLANEQHDYPKQDSQKELKDEILRRFKTGNPKYDDDRHTDGL